MSRYRVVLVSCLVYTATLVSGCNDEDSTRSSSNGGEAGTGGGATGGNATGGIATGGIATGGIATGGIATGGIATGGIATGGNSTGGVATGGTATGGTATGGTATGGTATGGVATGGNATGGNATGGNATGGVATGGTSSGGTTTTGGATAAGGSTSGGTATGGSGGTASACNDVQLPSQSIVPIDEPGAAPGPLTGGGTIPPGTYRIIERHNYGIALHNTWDRQRFVLDASGTWQDVYAWSNRPETHTTYQITTAGANLTMTPVCPPGAPFVETYEVIAGSNPLQIRFRLEVGSSVFVAVYQKDD